MIIKKIMCKVREDQKENFSECQGQWQSINNIEGFLGQIGGWNHKEPLTACIFSFWESQMAYQLFMDEAHDQVFLKSGQENTYTSIHVELLQGEFRIPGSEPDIVSVLRKANYVRTAFSQVKESRIDHFVEMQKEVWNPGMKKAEGMLGGEFARSQKNNLYYLVLTGWENTNVHEKYMANHFPGLIKTAAPEQDVVELTGNQFIVEESWRVCP
ncbi:YdbC family protein [Paenibacillus sp.]|jgi:heme-degrading monooxygenase HmoA|uniref:YdbC family protein n=1 Tax=Paenibacillus sp. TaxID=58172 RepID=UPI0028310960|nr:YdbC family protein [Paenibacillus sp.]MDR0271388.1 YdbC family protein [Paenibacillus sp.]